MKELSSLSAKMNDLHGNIIAARAFGFASKSDRLFNKRTQLLSLLHSCDDVLLIRVDQRSGQIAKHRHTMLGRAAEFTMCFLMSHFLSLGSLGSLVSLGSLSKTSKILRTFCT